MTSPPVNQNRSCVCELGKFDCLGQVSLFLQGHPESEAAAGCVVQQFSGLIHGIARKGLNSFDEAAIEDAVQEIWLKAFGSGENERPRLQNWFEEEKRGPFCLWLICLASNRLIDFRNHHARLRKKQQNFEDLTDTPAKQTSTDMDGLLEFLTEKVANLPPQLQRIFDLYYRQGLSARECCQRLDMPERTFFHRKAKLDNYLQSWGKSF